MSLPQLPSIAERLTFARRRAGLTQKEAAVAIHRSRHTIWEFETGKRPPPADSLFLLSEVYSVPEHWLRMREQSDPSPSTQQAPNPVIEQIRGKCLVDVGLYHTVMDAESLEDLQNVLPLSDTGFCLRATLPISSECELVSWREGEVLERRLQEKVQQLIQKDKK